MDNIQNDTERDKFLRDIGLTVGHEAVFEVVSTLEGSSPNSLYDLYTWGTRRDGTERKPICGKGTVYKIKKLYVSGKLDSYLKYLEKMCHKDEGELVDSKNLRNNNFTHHEDSDQSIEESSCKIHETATQNDHIMEIGNNTDIESIGINELNEIKVPKKKSDFVEKYSGKYYEEWEHYQQIVDAIIGLQHASVEERRYLLDQIQKERVTLDDGELQERLDALVTAVNEAALFDCNIPFPLVSKIISDTSKRMNKKYKRSR